MDKKELRELKSLYKSALLLGNDQTEVERKLKAAMETTTWDTFSREVEEVFLKAARALGDEVFARASDVNLPEMTKGDLAPFTVQAKTLGGGSQKHVMKSYERGLAARAEKKAEEDRKLQEGVKKIDAQMAEAAHRKAQEEAEAAKKKTPALATTREEPQSKNGPSAIPVPAKTPPPKAPAAKPMRLTSPLIPELPSEQLGPKPNPNALRALSAHRNDITALPESNKWIICIDESYKGRTENSSEAFSKGGSGVMVGVVFSGDNPLPKLGRQHCCEADGKPKAIEEGNRTLETILTHDGCGVLALPVIAQENPLGWRDVLIELIVVILRLLPYPEDQSNVNVKICVEPYNGLDRKVDFLPVEEVCKKALKDSFPERATRTQLDFEPMRKPRPDTDEVSYNAYADLVAHTCCMKDNSNIARSRYARTGWGGVCYLNEAPESIARILRYFDRQEPLEELAWNAVMANSQSSLIDALAKRIGERVKGKPEEWLKYLGYLDRHLKSGAINMRVLKLQTEWMGRYMPREPLGKKDELVWFTSKLTLANHEGRLDGRELGPTRRRFDELCEALFEEDATLVCDATLNLAVAYTNAFEFEMAFAMLDSLLSRDRAVVGTAAYGKLLSSRGQHYAFLGMADESRSALKEALACFARLSDEKAREINTDITKAYLTTVVMDHCPELALPQLKEFLTGSAEVSDEVLKETIHGLATGRDSKFHHHILLRYLVDADYFDVCRQAYRSFRDAWARPATGHPWEMIEFYRAFLAASLTEKLQHLESAYKIAREEGGETILVIAAVIAGAALAENGPDVWTWQKRFAELMDAIKDISGLKNTDRWRVLEAQPGAKLKGLELAKRVLPFNFR